METGGIGVVRGVRGATTVEVNEADHIIDETEHLLSEMIEKNNIIPENVASILISVTDDINDVFPAKAVRKFEGWEYVPIMCMQEIPVVNGLKNCVRVLMTVNTDIEQKQIQHIYLKDAVQLRPDLSGSIDK